MTNFVRQRNPNHKPEANEASFFNVPSRECANQELSNNKTKGISLSCFIAIVAVTIFLFFIGNKANLKLPDVKNSDDSEFNAKKGRYYLNGITNIGYRSVGSYENDVLTVRFILSEVEKIIAEASELYEITIELQHVSGGLGLQFLAAHFTNVYQNVTNVIVHLKVKNVGAEETGTLLINAHFDTEIKTQGASDDAVSCAIMLEILRVLSQSAPGTLKHDIIFLFNGAEEGILQGSHGFITQHPLAKKINTFINLEAAGSGGREVVFQTGPGHPWLIHTYASVAKYPFAFMLAQEVFQSGVIPSDTDFRIFRDYGKIPGIDFAYASNGYVYHTRHDKADAIPQGSIQRAGDNVLALTKAMCKSPYLTNAEQFQHGNVVFFDLLGISMILYPQTVGVIIDVFFSLSAFVYVLYKISRRKDDTTPQVSVKSLLKAFLVTVITLASAFVAVLSEAAVLNKLGKVLLWYSNPWYGLCLYGSTTAFVIFSIHTINRKLVEDDKECAMEFERSMIYSNVLLLAITVTLMTLKGILSTYPLTLWLIFPFIFLCIMGDSILYKGNSKQTSKFTTLHIMAMLVPGTLFAYYTCIVYDIFVPIMGRIGSELPPDYVIAAISFATVMLFSFYSVSLVYVNNNSSNRLVIQCMAALSALTFLLGVSGLIFPYSQKNPLSPKRIYIQHISRKFYNRSNMVTKEDSGIWLQPCDFTGMAPFKDNRYIQESTKVVCDGVYCGYPYYLPARALMRDSWYLQAPIPEIKNPQSMTVNSRELIGENTMRVHIEITGPDHMTLYITPKRGVVLSKWSLNDETPVSKPSHNGPKDICHFVYYAHGYHSESWKFFLDFTMTTEIEDAPLADFALASHYLHGESSNTELLQRVADSLPPWAVETAWVSNYEAFIL